ncbi:Sodium/potassium-transporting ATPase subunit beta-3 [Bagarius yarrelli]|uniref:Sodium/potassium-transporting ATPase subunit beta-3 n=1 Tax=Bagarius yarrelli TaxID=175774 RepID=A0A556U7B2_BAGYA|nr:Sodium/potassium-transporting ATPase subunit beta-3 [Bagarius yarrelli]
MANKEEKPEGKESSWKDFIYNPRTGEFLGRTASSWALIFLFYVVFYGFLAGMFSLTMWVMLQTLDDYTPRYRDRVANPGLMIRPKVLDIIVNRSNPQQYNEYVQELENFLLVLLFTFMTMEPLFSQREIPLQMQYFPTEGHIDKMYFPYYGKKAHAKYVQPLVAVKLKLSEQDYDTQLTIECKVEGSDLRNNDERDKFLGRITFRVKVTK